MHIASSQKMRALFDTPRFWRDLDRIRRERGVSWQVLGDETGIPVLKSPTLQSNNPHIDTLTIAAVWAGLSLDAYISRFDQAGRPLPLSTPKKKPVPAFQIGTRPPGYDMARFYTDLDQVRQARKMTWTGVWRVSRSTAVPLALPRFIREQIPLNERAARALAEWASLTFAEYVL